MRIALSYNKLKYVTMRTHRLLCVSSSAVCGAGARPTAQVTLGESMICTIIIHTRHKNVNITTHKITKEDEITGVSITTLHDVMHVESHRVIVTSAIL